MTLFENGSDSLNSSTFANQVCSDLPDSPTFTKPFCEDSPDCERQVLREFGKFGEFSESGKFSECRLDRFIHIKYVVCA
jgi:hypothetical protein